MSQFPKRRTLPMQPGSFRAAARKLRAWADTLDAEADADTPERKRKRTLAINRLARYAAHLSRRNRL